MVQVTVCLRSQHLTYSGPPSSTYALPFALGNLLPDWSNYYEGGSRGHRVLPPQVSSTPTGRRGRGGPSRARTCRTSRLGGSPWGTQVLDTTLASDHLLPGKPPHYVWRHTCTTIDFTTGTTVLVENGEKIHEVTSPELVRMYKVGGTPQSYPSFRPSPDI